jgi:hypothetical protein
MLSHLGSAGHATDVKRPEQENRQFYHVSEFSLRGSRERDITMPTFVMFTRNYFRPEWADKGRRRLKNISVVMEWCPHEAELQTGAQKELVVDLDERQILSLQKAYSNLLHLQRQACSSGELYFNAPFQFIHSVLER